MPLLSGNRELLDRFRDGDRQALTRVYDEYAPVIAAFLSRGFTFQSRGRLLQFCGYQQAFDLDNALQETFLRGFSERARLSYDGINPYRNYLTTIARNVVLSEKRQRELAASQLITPADESRSIADTIDPVAHGERAPSAESAAMHREVEGLLKNFVEELDDTGQAFFAARFEKKLSQVEAGKCVSLSHMQARTLEKKLRKALLSYMREHGYLESFAQKRKGGPS